MSQCARYKIPAHFKTFLYSLFQPNVVKASLWNPLECLFSSGNTVGSSYPVQLKRLVNNASLLQCPSEIDVHVSELNSIHPSVAIYYYIALNC